MSLSKKSQGFTLIELLVVIAIIGILASIVLASLSTARTKGQDAAIQSQLSSMRAQAELYYSTTGNNSYGPSQTTPTYVAPVLTSSATSCSTAGNLFAGTNVVNNLAALNSAVTTAKDCGASASAWSMAAQGATSTVFYCVDSSGVARSTTSGGAAYTGLVGASPAAHAAIGSTSCQ